MMSLGTKQASGNKLEAEVRDEGSYTAAEPKKNQGRYMPGLDGVRAIAVIAVILYHLNPSWIPGGFLGVGVFFVLSGYLITDLLISEWKQTGRLDLRDFWIRRFRRLLPALMAMLAVVAAWIALLERSRLSSLSGDMLAAVTYMNNWRFIYHHVSYFESFGPVSPITHLWSLAVEEQFYIVWPLLLMAGLYFAPRRGALLGLTLAGAAVSAVLMAYLYVPGADPSRVYYGTDTRIFALLLGASLAFIWPSRRFAAAGRPGISWRLELLGGAGLVAVLVMMLVVNQYDEFLYRGGLILLSLTALAVVAAVVHPSSRLGAWLGCKPLRWIGVRSYGIYLWHYPIIILTSPAVNTHGIQLERAAVQVGFSLLAAALSWRFIEEPIRRRASLPAAGSNRLIQFSRLTVSVSIVLVLGVGILAGKLQAVSRTTAVTTPAEAAIALEAVAAAAPPQTVASVSYGLPDAGAVVTTGGQQTNGANVPFASGNGAQEEQRLADNEVQGQLIPDPAVVAKESGESAGYGEQHDSAGAVSGQKDALPATVEQPLVVTAIGDSVMLDAEPYLTKLFPGAKVYAEVGRQMSQAYSIVEQLKAENSLGEVVIIELGTNGAFTSKQLESLIQLIGEQRQILLVNTRVPRPWEDVVNSAISQAATLHSNITLVDWYKASTDQDALFAPDGVHLQPKGAEFYASLIAGVLHSNKPFANKQLAAIIAP